MTACTCYRQPLYEPGVDVKITPNNCPLHGLKRTARKLDPATEGWLRQHIPVWGTMRDHAVAAGLIEPDAPELTKEQEVAIKRIERVRHRVLAALGGPANDEEV